MKIVYIIPSLEIKGGAERIVIEKANYLSEHYGYDVSIITQCHHNNAPIAYPLSEKIHHINLGIPYYNQYKYSYPKRLWLKWRINKRLRKETTDAVLQIDPDILITLPLFKPHIAYAIPCRAKKIIEVHEPLEYHLYSGFLNKSWISKRLKKHCFETVLKNADVFVNLTDDDRILLKKAHRVEVIPNFSSMKISQYSTCTAKRVIAVGRFSHVKGYERLLKIWGVVNAQYADWHLDIFGDGSLRTELAHYADDHHIKNVTIHEATHDISQEYANSSICTVTSYYEGFSLVILEAMMHGVPCVAFDCPNGPRCIIKDQQCGYLVENGNDDLFAERLCHLIKDQQLRKQFSDAAIERAKRFDIDIIMRQWQSLFESLCQ